MMMEEKNTLLISSCDWVSGLANIARCQQHTTRKTPSQVKVCFTLLIMPLIKKKKKKKKKKTKQTNK